MYSTSAIVWIMLIHITTQLKHCTITKGTFLALCYFRYHSQNSFQWFWTSCTKQELKKLVFRICWTDFGLQVLLFSSPSLSLLLLLLSLSSSSSSSLWLKFFSCLCLICWTGYHVLLHRLSWMLFVCLNWLMTCISSVIKWNLCWLIIEQQIGVK